MMFYLLNNKTLKIIGFTILLFLHCFLSIFSLQAQRTKSSQHSPAVLFLSEYISIPSETGNENAAATFLMENFKAKGFHIQIITDSIGCVNFAASLYPLENIKPNIVFLNHMDVVPVGDTTLWIYPPYSGTIAKGKVWGRGTLDNKGIAVMQIFAVEKFIDLAKKTDLPYNVTILCVSGEETGGKNGSAIVSKNFKENFNPIVVIGEGGAGMKNINFLSRHKSFFGISITEKTLLWLKLNYKVQIVGHASIAGQEYAYKGLINGLQKLTNKNQPIMMTEEAKLMLTSIGKEMGGIKGYVFKNLEKKIYRSSLKRHVNRNPVIESLLCNNITITNINSENYTPNQINMEVNATLDCRLLPSVKPEDIIQEIHNCINDSLLKITILNSGCLSQTSYPEFYFEKLAASIKKVFTNAEVYPMLLPASTDNSYYRDACPVYGINPMIISNHQLQSIHNYNEHIDIEDIEKGILVFEEFLNLLLLPQSSDL